MPEVETRQLERSDLLMDCSLLLAPAEYTNWLTIGIATDGPVAACVPLKYPSVLSSRCARQVLRI